MNKSFLFIFSVLILTSLFITQFGIEYHEEVHGSICERFGGAPDYDINLFEGKTRCKNVTFDSENEVNLYKKLHEQNEIYSYNLIDIKVFLMLIFVFTGLITYCLFEMKDDLQFYLKIKARGSNNEK